MSWRGGGGGGWRGGGGGRGGFGRGGPSTGVPAGPKPDPNKPGEPPPLYPPLERPPSPPPLGFDQADVLARWRRLRERVRSSPYYLKRVEPHVRRGDVERYSDLYLQAKAAHQPTLTSCVKHAANYFPSELLSTKPPRPGRPNEAAGRAINLDAFAALEKEEENEDTEDGAKKKKDEEGGEGPAEAEEAAQEEEEEDEANDYTASYFETGEDADDDDRGGDDAAPTRSPVSKSAEPDADSACGSSHTEDENWASDAAPADGDSPAPLPSSAREPDEGEEAAGEHCLDAQSMRFESDKTASTPVDDLSTEAKLQSASPRILLTRVRRLATERSDSPGAAERPLARGEAGARGYYPKERIVARTPRTRRGLVVEDAPEDESLRCAHYGECSGCTLDLDLNQPPIARDARRFFQERGVDKFPVWGGPVWNWRVRARLAVRADPETDELILGLFRAGSHEAVSIPECRIHHPAVNAVAELVAEGAALFGIRPYDEEDGSGDLRYVQCVVERATGAVQLSLVWNARDYRAAAKTGQLPDLVDWLVARSKEHQTALLHSVWVNCQTSSGNTILGRKWHHVWGPVDLWEEIAGARVCFTPSRSPRAPSRPPPGPFLRPAPWTGRGRPVGAGPMKRAGERGREARPSFGQANLDLFERMLGALHREVPPGSRVAEFYAGVGVIGLGLCAAGRAEWVRCCESNPGAQYAFERSREALGRDAAGRIEFHVADAAGSGPSSRSPPRARARARPPARPAPLRRPGGSADVAIVDPPRRGLDRPLIREIGVSRSLRRLVYVSCGFESLARDTALLATLGWRPVRASGFVFFPGTDSIETLAVFERERRPTADDLRRFNETGARRFQGSPAPAAAAPALRRPRRQLLPRPLPRRAPRRLRR
eukprot:tig00000880_g5161.t1